MLVNYVRWPARPTDQNLGIARVLLAAYAVWKLLSYDLPALEHWPRPFLEAHPLGALLPPGRFVGIELACAVAWLAVFAWGRALRTSGFLSALLVAHLVALHDIVTNSGTTFLPAVYLLLLWALFAEPGAAAAPPAPHAEPASARPLAPLRWGLAILASTYFFTGYSKLRAAGLAWGDPANLALVIHREALMHLDGVPFVGSLLIGHPVLAGASAWATLLLELGFLPAVLLGAPLLPFAVGLLGMHTLIALSMNILFFDQYVLFALFLPWDDLLARASAWSRR